MHTLSLPRCCATLRNLTTRRPSRYDMIPSTCMHARDCDNAPLPPPFLISYDLRIPPHYDCVASTSASIRIFMRLSPLCCTLLFFTLRCCTQLLHYPSVAISTIISHIYTTRRLHPRPRPRPRPSLSLVSSHLGTSLPFRSAESELGVGYLLGHGHGHMGQGVFGLMIWHGTHRIG
ncbi:hypothetical protein P153DRAFT_187782 [Dothidotthia symphoricarpi CBS 119687]|uniref:Uncharacterized protein n=1 Tax=Dothidotthia symphoricarpi CBS 119687 TaxID=1392245 RepID=A0A6A6AMW1_9PLEO|nr:uncharacterized protein P153DRAFT_187782 [Dothidotthia symphoricarpi CBS 119687]KAF2132264.1 hypothetical protein P153DRAFT_187782 [Dothidotthia symphoricarpi CBS 119687]